MVDTVMEMQDVFLTVPDVLAYSEPLAAGELTDDLADVGGPGHARRLSPDVTRRRFCDTIKDAVDPNGILSPGRHGIWPASMRSRDTKRRSRGARLDGFPPLQVNEAAFNIRAIQGTAGRHGSVMGSRKVAVVTGASRGIGEAVAGRLAREGMAVACTATSAETAEAAASRIRGHGAADAIGLRMQVEDAKDVERAIALVEEELGPVSVMVNNAGITSVASFLDMDVDDFSRVIDVNVKGVFNGSLTAAKRMVASGTRGSIVQIGSMAGINGFPGRVGYCSSKAAVHHMTKVMSLDLAAHGIRVNCVAPGYIRTDMVQDLVDQRKLDEGALRRRIPLGDLGDGADVAAAVAWLASDEARYVTGATLLVDGGWSAYGHI